MKFTGLALLLLAPCAATTSAAEKIQVDSVLITLIDQAEVPARESGVLAKFAVTEGKLVQEGDVLAQLEDSEAQLALERAKLERDIAVRAVKNDVKIRYARKSYEVAKTEAKRAQDSSDKFRKSVSQSELDQLRLVAERAELEIEQAEHDFEVARLTAELKENELRAAARDVERRKIVAPIAGVVVQLKRRRGEWVQPGETVVRILRMDQLRAEGFINAKQARSDLAGSAVTLTVDLPGQPKAQFPGTLVFVSPEVNPVNGQIRVWAETENRDSLLRPGLQATMAISPGSSR